MQIKKIIYIFVVALCLGEVPQGHTLFLKMDTFFVDSEGQASVYLINGTFDQSENTIARDRMADVSLVLPGGERTHPEKSLWRDEGTETFLDFKTSGPGTYVVGVSTYTRNIELTANEFNEYLRHDGVDDALEARKKEGRLGEDVTERYSKHVKAIVQVGDDTSSDFSAELGYPVEIVPMLNPYNLREGDRFCAKILKNGKPLPGQKVYASPEEQSLIHGQENHDEIEDHARHMEPIEAFSDGDGVIEFMLSGTGRWYVRFINMVEVDEPGVDYESNWATLTFEVKKR